MRQTLADDGRTSVVRLSPTVPWRCRFITDAMWNDDTLNLRRRVWATDVGPGLAEGGALVSHLHGLIEVWQGDACLLSVPAYRNAFGEWGNFNLEGEYDIPAGEVTAVEYISESIAVARVAVKLAADLGVKIDLVHLVSIHDSFDAAVEVDALSPWPKVYRAHTPYAFGRRPLADYIASRPKKLRGQMRRVLRRCEGWTYTYDKNALLYPWASKLMREWYNETFDAVIDGAWMLAMLQGIVEKDHAGQMARVYVFRDAEGKPVGLDVLINMGPFWESFITPYFKQYRSLEAGKYAMLALIEKMNTDDDLGDEVSIGTPLYSIFEDGREIQPDPAMVYKQKWGNHRLPTYGIGYGLWEDRDAWPTVELGGIVHTMMVFQARLFGTTDHEEWPHYAFGVEPYATMLPEGWEHDTHLLDNPSLRVDTSGDTTEVSPVSRLMFYAAEELRKEHAEANKEEPSDGPDA